MAGTDATYCLAFAPSTVSRSAAPGRVWKYSCSLFILEMEGARYAALYLDAYTGPGTATDSLGRYVPKVGTVSKVEQASTAASVSAFAATGFLYDGSPVYGS